MVRVRDVCELMDVRYIQTYVINSARVVFLSERPHPRGKKESGKDDAGMNASTSRRSKGKDEPKKYSACVHCSRTLQAPTADYCSISCKVSAGADMAPTIEAATEAAAESEAAGVGTSGKGAKRDREGDAAQDQRKHPPSPASRRRRRRRRRPPRRNQRPSRGPHP